jgi:AraC-like DNA-binding protein
METKYIPQNEANAVAENAAKAFQAMLSNKDMFFQFLDMFPYMITVYAPDGTGIFINRAGCEEMNIADPNDFVGRHNVHHDPMIDMLGFRDGINKVYQGGTASAYDIRVPFEDISEQYDEKDDDFNRIMYQDISGFPLFDEGGNIVYVIALFITRLTYSGKTDIIKAQEYMKNNWFDEFDIDKVAQAASLSRRHFQRMFKEVMGIAPIEYYKSIKVDKLKEKLRDPNLNITEAFAACGVEYNTTWVNAFKVATGQSPSGFRRQ